MTNSPTVSGLVKTALALTAVSLALMGCGPAATSPSADEAAPEVVSVATQEPEEAATEPATEPTETTAETTGDTTGATVQPGGTLIDGSVVSGELTRAGQKDVYVIDLGEAREFYVADMNGSTDLQFQAFSDVETNRSACPTSACPSAPGSSSSPRPAPTAWRSGATTTPSASTASASRP
ncbi:hypothetical protein Aple_056120 [Acrocarpospora pleiomorpha]|uniref:Uncharacterized protein n=1 Tax=Acrocarpospora pleiomorpha TaxID=90975 RepID=A0A5M3XTW3_9ACTN|nr:hypothetical protein [Acrocarpospora pleiomorpha]GES22713.1 hypothetical protein Aple_056120 [Acrocarpospora pleiomorpha]